MDVGLFLQAVFASKLFWCIALTFVVAHAVKSVSHWFRFKTWSWHTLTMTGGMPSSHTATATALTIGLAFETGPSPLFFLSALFTLIVLRDSYGVRKAVSDQANLINAMTSEMKIHKKAKIVLGHTPLQVFVGFLLGVLIALSLYVF